MNHTAGSLGSLASVAAKVEERKSETPAFAAIFHDYVQGTHSRITQQAEVVLASLPSFELIINSKTIAALRETACNIIKDGQPGDSEKPHTGETLYMADALTFLSNRQAELLQLSSSLSVALVKGGL